MLNEANWLFLFRFIFDAARTSACSLKLVHQKPSRLTSQPVTSAARPWCTSTLIRKSLLHTTSARQPQRFRHGQAVGVEAWIEIALSHKHPSVEPIKASHQRGCLSQMSARGVLACEDNRMTGPSPDNVEQQYKKCRTKIKARWAWIRLFVFIGPPARLWTADRTNI